MKKLIITTAMLLTFTTTILVARQRLDIPPELWTSLSILAVCSDVAGVGVGAGLVRDPEPYDAICIIIHVDEPLFGCTNQQIVAVLNDLDDAIVFLNAGRIAFLVHTNSYYNGQIGNWDMARLLEDEGDLFPSLFKFKEDERSWFPVDEDNGLVFTQLTNLVHVLRTERNWTNFYEVTRSGVTSSSERVSKDSEADLESLMKYASLDQLLLMQNDPLFPAVLAAELARQITLRQ
jgi:hypothetical protein